MIEPDQALTQSKRWLAVLALTTILYGPSLSCLIEIPAAWAGQPVHDTEADDKTKQTNSKVADTLTKMRKVLDLTTSIYNATGARGQGRVSRILSDNGMDMSLVTRSRIFESQVPDRSAVQSAGVAGATAPTDAINLSNVGSSRQWIDRMFGDGTDYQAAAAAQSRRNAAIAMAARNGMSVALAAQNLAPGDADQLQKLVQLANTAQDLRDKEAVTEIIMMAITDEHAIQRRVRGAKLELKAGRQQRPQIARASDPAAPGATQQ